MSSAVPVDRLDAAMCRVRNDPVRSLHRISLILEDFHKLLILFIDEFVLSHGHRLLIGHTKVVIVSSNPPLFVTEKGQTSVQTGVSLDGSV